MWFSVLRILWADLSLRRTSVSQENDENLYLCLSNVDEHNLLNMENVSQPQECGELIIRGEIPPSNVKMCFILTFILPKKPPQHSCQVISLFWRGLKKKCRVSMNFVEPDPNLAGILHRQNSETGRVEYLFIELISLMFPGFDELWAKSYRMRPKYFH
jgi:hypothetical protein